MKTKQPLVSVIMPVFNAGKFLVPAIESILAQTYPHFELLIVDDGSTDDSWKTIKRYKRRFPKIIRTYRVARQLNYAGNGATDIGLSRARGRFVARMDADDIAHPKRLEKQVAFLLSHPGTILVGSQARVINQHGKTIGFKRVPLSHEEIYQQYALVHPVIHPSIMINRRLLPNPNALYLHKWGVNDDYYTFFRLLTIGRFANLPEPLINYRIHSTNASLSHLKEKFMNTFHIRLEVITRFSYRMSVTSLLLMLGQYVLVMLLPESLLQVIYPVARGMSDSRKRIRRVIKRIAQKLPPLFLLPERNYSISK